MPEPTRKLAAIVFTDIVGFTKLSAQNEPAALNLLEKQRELLKPIVEKHGGSWLKEIGDGLLLSFNTNLEAEQSAFYFKNIYELLLASYSISLVSLFVPFTAGIWWPKTNNTGAIMAMLSGLISWILFMVILPDHPEDLYAMAVSIVGLIFGSLLTQNTDHPIPLTDLNGNSL